MKGVDEVDNATALPCPSAELAAARPRQGSPRPAASAATLGAVSVEEAIAAEGNTVLRLALARCGNRPDAEDVFQDVFLRLHRDAPRFADAAHLKAWLVRVTVNCCNDRHRTKTRHPRVPIDAPQHASAADGEALQRWERDRSERAKADELAEALETLTPKQRVAVHLFYYEGYATDEIARLTGERPATVRSHLFRARHALKIELGGQR